MPSMSIGLFLTNALTTSDSKPDRDYLHLAFLEETSREQHPQKCKGCLQAGLYQLLADPIFAASSRPASQKIGWDHSRFRATFAPYTIAPKILLFSPECGGPEHLLHTLQGPLYASRSFAKISKL